MYFQNYNPLGSAMLSKLDVRQVASGISSRNE